MFIFLFETCARGPSNVDFAGRLIRDGAPLEIQVGKRNFINFHPSRLHHAERLWVWTRH